MWSPSFDPRIAYFSMEIGLGGVKILRALEFDEIDRRHLNEGHATLLIAGLLEEVLPAGDDPPCPPLIVEDQAALDGSFFTTERMMREYRTNAYRL